MSEKGPKRLVIMSKGVKKQYLSWEDQQLEVHKFPARKKDEDDIIIVIMD